MKFLHVADCHVGKKQYSMVERERDFERAFDGVVSSAIEEKVDAILIAGDLFDVTRPNADNVLAVKTSVGRAKEHGIRVVAIEGNHDRLYDGQWLRVCGIEAVDCADGELPRFVEVCGVPVSGAMFRDERELLAALDEYAEFCKADPSAPKRTPVFMLHVGLAEMGDSFSANTSIPVLLPKLQDLGVEYVALGHIHVPSEQVHGGIWFCQPGSTEVCAIDEDKSKYAEIVEISKREDSTFSEANVSRIMLNTRPFSIATITTDEELDSFLNRLDAGEFDGRFVDVYVMPSVTDGVERLSAIDRRGVMNYVHKCGSEQSKTIDRKKTFASLDEIVDDDYPESTDENYVIKQMLSVSADGAAGVASNYRTNGKPAYGNTESNSNS